MTNKPTKHDITYMRMALALATGSYARRRKVGCIITSQDTVPKILSEGYNGTFTGESNQCEGEDGKTLPGVIHAEINALNKLPYSVEPKTLYVTVYPCECCAKVIRARTDITRLVYCLDYSKSHETLKDIETVQVFEEDAFINLNRIDLDKSQVMRECRYTEEKINKEFQWKNKSI